MTVHFGKDKVVKFAEAENKGKPVFVIFLFADFVFSVMVPSAIPPKPNVAEVIFVHPANGEVSLVFLESNQIGDILSSYQTGKFTFNNLLH